MLDQLKSFRWYLYISILASALTFWFTSKADETSYQKTVALQNQVIDALKHTVDVLKQTSTTEEKKYDPTTGNLISDTTKTDTKDETKTTDETTKTTTNTKTDTVAKTESSSRVNTVVAGYGYDSGLSKVYSVEYLRRFEFLDVGALVQSGKEVQASLLVGISF
jgi:hypothetical protein